MKYQSTHDPEIYFEKLEDTPICYLEDLEFDAMLDIGGWDPLFFFRGWKKNKKRRSYVGYYLKFKSKSPYRVMEEHVAHSTVWDYLSAKGHLPRNEKGLCRVYRLWGTPYIKEMNVSGIYSDFKEDTENRVFQLMIITDDETIEIVRPLGKIQPNENQRCS